MNTALWVVQVLTALAFGQHGYSVLFQVEQARTRFAWTRDVSPTTLRVVGTAEILGAIGVIVPAATGVLPWLTVGAAAGLVTVMVLAIAFHVTRREWPNVGINLIFGLLAFAVAYGRLVIEPF
jgi:hypothetical protein